MTNVEELKAMLKEASERFGNVNGDSYMYSLKLFYLTGYMNGVMKAEKMSVNFTEMCDLLTYKTELLKEE